MKKLIRIKLIIIGGLLGVFTSCQQSQEGLPYYTTPDFTPRWEAELKEPLKKLHRIAPFQFTNQLGQKVANKDLAGKIYVANFFFTTCPSICPKMTTNLFAVQQAFNKDQSIKLVSYSVMPWFDSVPMLKKYAAKNHVDNEKWHLLTGEKDKIYEIARQSYFAEKGIGLTKSNNEFLHTENVFLIDGEGHIRGVYNGTLPLEMERLIEDVKILKKHS
ncbi:SCO family protein [marine bacterium AO1-C]|nr:SCO family protein [marine bacterium AO1-C]